MSLWNCFASADWKSKIFFERLWPAQARSMVDAVTQALPDCDLFCQPNRNGDNTSQFSISALYFHRRLDAGDCADLPPLSQSTRPSGSRNARQHGLSKE
jgi:hypothetical protein